MSNKSRGLTSRPLWVVTSYQRNRIHLLTLGPEGNDGGDGFCLPVFSFEEEARAFLHFFVTNDERELRVRETRTAELISMLLGPYFYVRRVALDPLLLRTLFGEMLPLVSISRERFVQDLIGERRGSPKELVPN